MRFSFYLLTAVFILLGCQGRGLSMHPSLKRGNVKIKPVENDTSTKTGAVKDKNFPRLKLKGRDLSTDKSLFSNIPIVNKIAADILPSVDEIPVIRDIKKFLPKSAEVAKKRLNKRNKRFAIESFSGGSPVNGLDIGMVRLGQSKTFSRLIFDSYKWEGYAQIPTTRANDSGTYIFTYEPKHKRITAILDGYQAFSALVGDHEDLYEGNDMVRTIHLDEYLDQSGFKFTIELKQEADIRVYELHNPARIIIDMFPKNNEHD